MATGSATSLARGAFVALMVTTGACAAKDERWVEEARLHDGRTLEVQRTVIYRRGSGDLTSFFTYYPTEYALEFQHPTRRATIRWRGVNNVNPIAIQLLDDVPYLTVYGTVAGVIYRNASRYGCPEVPYAFLKYDFGKGDWTPIAPKDAPGPLRHANLAGRWDSYWMSGGRLSAEKLAEANAAFERSGSGHFRRAIPIAPSEWPYRYAKRDQTARYPGDCRAPLEQPIDAVFPMENGVLAAGAIAVEPEILERKDFDPPWVLSDSSPEWRQRVSDQTRSQRCRAFLRPADPEDTRIRFWSAFTKDPTGKKITSRSAELCDEDVLWFFYQDPRALRDNRLVVAKVTPQGEVLYRLSFDKPDAWGFIARPTFTRKDGYLHFDWWDASTGMNREVKKILTMRVKEPAGPGR